MASPVTTTPIAPAAEIRPGTAPAGRRLSDRTGLVLVWLVLAGIPLVAPNAYVISLANMGLINLILIAGLNLVMGFGGQISLAHAGFFGLGAYASGVVNVHFGLSPWLGLPLAALAAALGALVIGLPALRLKGHYLSMATLGWNAILVVLFTQLVDVTGGPNGLLGVMPFSLFGIELATEERVFPLVWGMSLLTMLGILNLLASRIGRAVRAVATNELGAAALGINAFRTKLLVFVLSAATAGIAGSLYVHVNMYASPETFGIATSILLIVMVAIGGAGTFWGPLAGAVVMTAIPPLLLDYEDAELMLFGASMLVVLIVFPGGIAAIPAALARRLRKGGPA